jgi:hypothetical protein
MSKRADLTSTTKSLRMLNIADKRVVNDVKILNIFGAGEIIDS